MRSETQICEKCCESGLSQKWSVKIGSRTEIWPATPSSKPRSANLRDVSRGLNQRVLVRGAHILKAAARCCLRYTLSSSKVSNFGYERILSLFPETVFPSAPSCEFPSVSPFSVVAVGAIVYNAKRRCSRLHEKAVLVLNLIKCGGVGDVEELIYPTFVAG